MIQSRRHVKKVQVAIKTKDRLVFEGVFTIYCLSDKLAAHFRLKPQF